MGSPLKQRDFFPTTTHHRRANSNMDEPSKLRGSAKALRNAADRLADIKGEGALVTHLRGEAARLERKRTAVLKRQADESR